GAGEPPAIAAEATYKRGARFDESMARQVELLRDERADAVGRMASPKPRTIVVAPRTIGTRAVPITAVTSRIARSHARRPLGLNASTNGRTESTVFWTAPVRAERAPFSPSTTVWNWNIPAARLAMPPPPLPSPVITAPVIADATIAHLALRSARA